MKRRETRHTHSDHNMSAGLLLLLLLLGPAGHVASEEHGDVSCLVMDFDYVDCVWTNSATPEVNYTFYSNFMHTARLPCARYVLEAAVTVGCHQPYDKLSRKRFQDFTTTLVLGNRSSEQIHNLKSKVKLKPPTGLRVRNESDGNLWFYWNYGHKKDCMTGEVRHRTNGQAWTTDDVQGEQYCINLPSHSRRYELQVRVNVAPSCGASIFWSEWSTPVFWGSNGENNGTGGKGKRGSGGSISVWTVVMGVVGSAVLLLLLGLLVQHERLRVILIPVLPDPGKNLNLILSEGKMEDWLPVSEGFKAVYSEHVCSVREYSRLPLSASESSAHSESSAQSEDSTHSTGSTESSSCADSVANAHTDQA